MGSDNPSIEDLLKDKKGAGERKRFGFE